MKTKTLVSFDSPLGAPVKVIKQTFTACKGRPVKRVSFVAGLHGDELEGLYLCHRLIRALRELKQVQPEAFLGDIHIYPAVNPPAVNSATRLWPFYSEDMNRTLGQETWHSVSVQVSRTLFEDLKAHSDLAVDIHSSNKHLLELPQIRIIENFAGKLVPLAQQTCADLIWVHPMAGLFESTLGYNLNLAKIPTLVIETGICLRIHPQYGDQLFHGMMHLLNHVGVLATRNPPAKYVKAPRMIHPNQVAVAAARQSGLFVGQARLGSLVKQGEPLGQMLNPITGDLLEEVVSPGDGLLFTLRQLPLVYSGALLARVALDREPEP